MKVIRTNKSVYILGLLLVPIFLLTFYAASLKSAPVSALTRSAHSFDLTSSVSRNELTSYTDQVTINFTVKHNDSISSLKSGMLEIDFNGSSFEPIGYAKDGVGNSNVSTASFNALTRKLTVKLKDPIMTGTQFDYSVIAIPIADAVNGNNLNAKATLNGKNSTGISYVEESTITDNIKFNSSGSSFNPVNPTDPTWKIYEGVEKNYSLYPGESQQGGLYFWLRNKTAGNESFKNLKIKYEKSANVGSAFEGRKNVNVGGLNASWTQLRPFVGKELVNTPTEKIYEFGGVNGNIDKTFLGFFDGSVPLDATPGIVYNLKMSFYDEDNLIGQGAINITVKGISSVVTFNSVAVPSEVKEASGDNYDYFDWKQTNKIETAGNGVKDYTVTLNIPAGTKPMQLTPPSNNGTFIKKVEYFNNGTWTQAKTKIGTSYNLTSVPDGATKLRYIYNDIPKYNEAQVHNNLFVRFKNVSNLSGVNIPLKVESVTYTDHVGANRSVPNIASYDRTVKVVNSTNKATNQANANVMTAAGYTDPWNVPHFNGENIYQSVRVGSVQKDLENPYIYMIMPKGLEIDSNPNNLMRVVRPYYTGFNIYTLTTLAQDIISPKSMNDIKYEKINLANNEVLHFWSLEGLTLKGGGQFHSQVMGADVKYKINNLKSGNYNIVYGLGSLTDDSYAIYGGVPYGDLQFTNTNSNVKDKIAKLASNKEFTTTKKLSIGINNSISTKMDIKGSQDGSYIDATAGTATSIPGKDVNYRVSLSNAGTNDLTNFEAVEILPYVGDKLSTDPTQNRGSQYNVNLGSIVKVLIDGAPSNDVTVMYSTSNDPVRFDTNGNSIGTGAWTATPPSDLSTVKSIKVLMKTKPFKIGSTIQLEFSGTLPLDAPRNGEVAYNTVSMKADTVTVSGPGLFISEPAKGGVKSTAPATDLELSGKIYMDFNKTGDQDVGEVGYNGVTLNLYKKNGSDFAKVDSVVTAPDGSNNAGIFGFTGMANGTYKIEAVKPNRAEFVSVGNNSFVDNGDGKAWLKYKGQTEFSVDDLAAQNPKKIIDFSGPLYVEGEFKGTISFVDKEDNLVEPNDYKKDFSIQLLDASGTNIGSPVFSDVDGKFKISHLITARANYTLQITKPKTGFVYSVALNSADLNQSSGEYTLSNVEPGESVSADVYITDLDDPTVSINMDKANNPTDIQIVVNDSTTKTTLEWVIKKDGVIVANGDGVVTLPTEYGDYTIEARATDAALNESNLIAKDFTISPKPKTPPVTITPPELGEIIAPNTGNK